MIFQIWIFICKFFVFYESFLGNEQELMLIQFYVHKSWLVFIIRFFSLLIDAKMFGFRFAVSSFSARFKVAIVRQWRNISGCRTFKLLCWRLSSVSWVCFWKISASNCDNSLFFKLRTFKFISDLNDSLLMLRKRLHDKSRLVSFVWFWNNSGEKFVSLLSSKCKIRSNLRFDIACGWITKMLFLLKFNSSRLDWCWNIRWQTMPIWFSCSKRVFNFFSGRNVSQCKFLIWFLLKFNFSRFPGPINASLSISVSWLLSIVTSLRIKDFLNSFGGSVVNRLFDRLTYCKLGKSDNTSEDSSVNPAFSKLQIAKFWNRWMISLGMVLNWSGLMCKYLMFSSLMFFVFMITTSDAAIEILHESPNFVWE